MAMRWFLSVMVTVSGALFMPPPVLIRLSFAALAV